jgi:methylthioribulose 1-phosphate dehydratase / enolase-phosphatase E1
METIILQYLDAPHEKGTNAVLRQLGISIADLKFSRGSILDHSKLASECNANVDVEYTAHEGVFFVDVRDSGDCWIRCTLTKGKGIKIPSTVHRRVISAGGVEGVLHTSDQSILYNRRFNVDADYRINEAQPYHNYRELVCELCRIFFNAGWVTGTGGSISIRHGERIYMTPSGVQKERISPDELFVLDIDGNLLCTPEKKPTFTPKLSDCSPLFLHAFKQRNAGAVLHSHAISTNLITSLFEGKDSFRISHQEMIKGISGHGYFDELVVPIIENTAHEHELADALGECIANNPKTCAVLVRRHGMYVWGKNWEEAKRHGECLHYLFDIALKMKSLDMDFTRAPLVVSQSSSSKISGKRGLSDVDVDNKQNQPSKQKKGNNNSKLNLAKDYKHVVFDIEGTTTPITYVKDVLFPYSSNNITKFLEKTYNNSETSTQMLGLWSMKNNAKQIPTNKKEYIKSVSDIVKNLIQDDIKDPFLKSIQGRIWKEAYSNGTIKSVVYDDVPSCFDRLQNIETKISIYSSGSRQAQQLLFKYSDHGDLRHFINCYFDTQTAGQKRIEQSYKEICLSLGVEKPEEILFVTDIYEEAVAAKAAGMGVVISSRQGNAPLPKEMNTDIFPVITSFDDL